MSHEMVMLLFIPKKPTEISACHTELSCYLKPNLKLPKILASRKNKWNKNLSRWRTKTTQNCRMSYEIVASSGHPKTTINGKTAYKKLIIEVLILALLLPLYMSFTNSLLLPCNFVFF